MKLTAKLYAIAIYRHPGDKTCSRIAIARDLSHFSYFHQEAISDFLDRVSKKVASTARVGAYSSVQREEFGETYVSHVFACSAELACVVVCDPQYPYRIGFDICTKVLRDFMKKYPETQVTKGPEDEPQRRDMPFPQLQGMLDKYKKPEQADTLLKMRRDIAETAKQMHENMDTMLERGDKVENLVRKSDMLKDSGKVFRRIVKKHAPTPARSLSDKIKASLGLAIASLLLAGLTFGTSNMITTTISPQNRTAVVTKFTASFGLVKTCFSASTSDDLTFSACMPSRALGGTSGCEGIDDTVSSGTVPSFLGLISMGIYFIAVLMGVGFSICISRKPDMRRVFAIIALGMHVLASVGYGLAVYAWVNAYVLPYFTNAHPGNTWCVTDAKVNRYLRNHDGDGGSLLQYCDTQIDENGCEKTLAWGYSSFIFWLGFGAQLCVMFLQCVESFQVMFGVDKVQKLEEKLNEQGIGHGNSITDPLLVNADT